MFELRADGYHTHILEINGRDEAGKDQGPGEGFW